MVQFGRWLREHALPEWRVHYVAYDALKRLLRQYASSEHDARSTSERSALEARLLARWHAGAPLCHARPTCRF